MHRLLSSAKLSSTLLSSGLVFAGAWGEQDDRAHYLESITVGRPGKCSEIPVKLDIVTDNSGSVTGGNDPVGRRFDEACLAIARVGVRCRCGEDLVATLTFDSPTSLDLPPTPITSPNLREIKKSLAIPPDGAGSSNLGPSLDRCFQLASQHRDYHKVLVILSDFQLFDPNPSAVLAKLTEYPGDVHAVVLGTSAPTQLIHADNITVTEVDHASPAGTVARAVFTALTATRPGAQPLAPVRPGSPAVGT